MAVRGLTRRTAAAAALPAKVEVVAGELSVRESLDAALRCVGAVFLVWSTPAAAAPRSFRQWVAAYATAFMQGPAK